MDLPPGLRARLRQQRAHRGGLTEDVFVAVIASLLERIEALEADLAALRRERQPSPGPPPAPPASAKPRKTLGRGLDELLARARPLPEPEPPMLRRMRGQRLVLRRTRGTRGPGA